MNQTVTTPRHQNSRLAHKERPERTRRGAQTRGQRAHQRGTPRATTPAQNHMPGDKHKEHARHKEQHRGHAKPSKCAEKTAQGNVPRPARHNPPPSRHTPQKKIKGGGKEGKTWGCRKHATRKKGRRARGGGHTQRPEGGASGATQEQHKKNEGRPNKSTPQTKNKRAKLQRGQRAHPPENKSKDKKTGGEWRKMNTEPRGTPYMRREQGQRRHKAQQGHEIGGKGRKPMGKATQKRHKSENIQGGGEAYAPGHKGGGNHPRKRKRRERQVHAIHHQPRRAGTKEVQGKPSRREQETRGHTPRRQAKRKQRPRQCTLAPPESPAHKKKTGKESGGRTTKEQTRDNKGHAEPEAREQRSRPPRKKIGGGRINKQGQGPQHSGFAAAQNAASGVESRAQGIGSSGP